MNEEEYIKKQEKEAKLTKDNYKNHILPICIQEKPPQKINIKTQTLLPVFYKDETQVPYKYIIIGIIDLNYINNDLKKPNLILTVDSSKQIINALKKMNKPPYGEIKYKKATLTNPDTNTFEYTE